MLEKWVEGLIVEYFSEWLEGFDKDGVRIGLFSGKLCFQNLKFRKQALDKLNVPIVLKEGRLGSLHVKVPWKRLSKESVHIVLEDLYLLVGPYHDESSETQTTVDDRMRHAKQHDIRLRELLQATANDAADAILSPPTSPTKPSSSSSNSWKQKMLNLVLDNLMFELKHIHIRYEDTSRMVSNRPVSFGLSIDQLKVATTNANGHVMFMDRSASHTPFVHKLFDVVEGYIYWDLHAATTTPSDEALTASKMTYLVEPMTTSIKITENHDAVSHQFIPQYRVHIALPSLRMTISPSQCKDVANVVDFLVGHEVYLKRSHCRKARPRCSVHESPKRWWKYAIQSVQALEHNPHKCTWRKTIALLVLRSQYIALYMRLLPLLAAEKPIPDVDAQQRRILEDDPRLSADCIVFFRACAAAELEMEANRRKQLAKSTATAGAYKWTSMLKKSSSKQNTPVGSPRTGVGFFSPKHAVAQPSSPAVTTAGGTSPVASPKTSAAASAPSPLLTLDPLERQLVYEGVSQRHFDPPGLKKAPPSAPSSPTASLRASTATTADVTLKPGQLLGLDIAIAEIVCAVAKEPKGASTTRKEFVRFLVADFVWTYNQHMRQPTSTGISNATLPPEVSTVFQIRDMQLVDATQPSESPLAVIFGHAKKAKMTALVVVKYNRRPGVETSLHVAIDACNLLYHKTAVDKMYKYITPDQNHSSKSTKAAAGPTEAPPAAETSPSYVTVPDGPAAAMTTPLRLTVDITDATINIAGESARTAGPTSRDDIGSCPFLVVHATNIHVRSSDVAIAVETSADTIDTVVVDQVHVASVWDELSLQANCRVLKKLKLQWTIRRDELCWSNNVRLSTFAANMSEVQVRQLVHLGTYLSQTKRSATATNRVAPAVPARPRIVPVEIAVVVPTVSVRLVGNERLRNGLFVEATSMTKTVKCMRDLTSIHFTVAALAANEATHTSGVHRPYSFGRTLLRLSAPLTVFTVVGRDAPPTLRVDVPQVHFCWHYHLIQDILALVVAPMPLPPPVDSTTTLFLHVRLNIGTWTLAMNPVVGPMEIELSGHDVESTVEVFVNGDVFVDATVSNVEMITTSGKALQDDDSTVDAEMPPSDKTRRRDVLFTLPDSSTVRYEASGEYSLQDRDGAAAFLDICVTRAHMTYIHVPYSTLATYTATYVAEVFTWLYLAREGETGKTTMDPSMLRMKLQGSIDRVDVTIPNQTKCWDHDDGSFAKGATKPTAITLQATGVQLSSARYLDTPYEQLTVTLRRLKQPHENRQLVTIHIPTLHAALDVAALDQVLSVVATNFMAPCDIESDVDRPLLALGVPLRPATGVETTVSMGVESFDVSSAIARGHCRLAVQALHVGVHATATSQTTVEVTWLRLDLADADRVCQVQTSGRPHIELEIDPTGQTTLEISLDGLHVIPDVQVLSEWTSFGLALGTAAATYSSAVPAAATAALSVHVKVRAVQIQLSAARHDAAAPTSHLVLHTGVHATLHKSILRVEGNAITLVVAHAWPLPPALDLPDAFHLALADAVGRALCVPFHVEIDVASTALQVELSPVELVLSPTDLWLLTLTASAYAAAIAQVAFPTTSSPSRSTPTTSDFFVSVVVSQASITLVAPESKAIPSRVDGQQASTPHLVPKIRVYGHRALFKYSSKYVAAMSQSTEWSVSFTDDSCGSVDDGMSVWCFNGALGVWEPWIEPWSYMVAMVQTVEDDTTIHRHVVPPHTKAALDLPRQSLMVTDQTIGLSWAHTWQPLHDVRLHAFGQSVVLVPATANQKQVMPLLLDVETRQGQRTLTISAIVKVYNDCSVPLRIGCVRGGNAIVDAGIVAPFQSKGLPLEMCETLHGLRLVVGPARDDAAGKALEGLYQWSDAFPVDAADELVASCPLKVLESKNCLCMPSFSTTSPQLSSTSELCKHGKMYFKVVPQVKTAAGHPYALVRIVAPCTIENHCPVPLSLLVFTTKKHSTKPVSAKGPALDEEIEPIQLHLVTAMTVPSHTKVHLYQASLQFKTYAALALAEHQWSQLQPMDMGKDKESIVALRDCQRRTHTVNWHAASAHHQLVATIWPTYVLVDESKLNVLFDVELTAKKSLSSLLHLSNSKNSSKENHSSATDTLETDVIEATLDVLGEMAMAQKDPNAAAATPVQPYLLSGTSHVTIRLDPVRGIRTSTASIHLDAISDSVQNCHRLFSDALKEWHDLGVRMTLTSASRSKIVTIHPRYMVLNVTPYPFLLCPTSLVNKTAAPSAPFGEAAASLARTGSFPRAPTRQTSAGRVPGPPVGVSTFAPNAPFAPFHWSSMADPTDYSVRTKPGESSGWKWSGKFDLHQVGETALNVINKATNDVYVVRIHIRVVHATQIWIVISLEEASHALYRLVNHTSMRLQFWQQFDMDPGYVRDVGAAEDVWFGWDEPYGCEERTIQVCVPEHKVEASVVVDQINDVVQTLQVGGRDGDQPITVLYVQVYLDGLTKVLHVSERRTSRDTLMRISSTAASANIRYVVDLVLPSLVLALVHGGGEVVVVTIGESSIIGGYTPDGNEIEVKVHSVQIDNQHTKACPVLFAPSKEDMDKSVAATKDEATPAMPTQDASPPFLHVSIVRLFYHPDIEFFKYLSVLMQPASLQLDASILFTVANMVSDWLGVATAYFPDLFTDKPVAWVAQTMHSEPRVYFETLQLHPLKLCVTFTQSTLPSQAEEVMAVVPGMFRILQTNLANIDNAPLHLNALHIFHSYTSLALLVSCVRQHYTSQSLRQIYSLIGSAEILGNPLGLVSNLGSGVKDFFYEPAAGMVRGPGQFVKGLTRGTESLVKNSVYGTFNAASKLTGSISTGLATLSMDKSYIQSRSNRPKKDGPTNVGAGLLLGTKQLGQGILAGVSGILTQPAMGAYHNGLTGFVEGVGKGIIGAAVKPTAGILDLAAQTTAGITYSAASFDKKPKLKRVRLPRVMITPDKRLTMYSAEEASVAWWLSKLPANTLHPTEQYDMHVLLPSSRALISTSHQLMVVDTAAKPRVLWAYPVWTVRSTNSMDDGVQLCIAPNDDSTSGKVVTVQLILDSAADRDRVEAFVCKLVSRHSKDRGIGPCVMR
ncbi:hypothetical protein H310_04665 [Aphanomyces invadans]|uniref:Uncharacterized protein n=1 Tax=Aphanomyces invadans TaxID=157072 RepID=A0A024UDV1_9STRA|nr:hypothetical protein H310_04665 [Aphanomyces invadans]ETW04380.1 hypothetical protein H310_04665 [Aphanomyces invadans]|eukprot:XP_008867336.1 hypothetical protein H310_04665 [Aphanomyces invadans]